MSKVNYGIGFLEAYIKKYFREEEAKVIFDNYESNIEQAFDDFCPKEDERMMTKETEYDANAVVNTSYKMKSIEFLGFKHIWSKIRDVGNLRYLALSGMNIGRLPAMGNLRKLFPKVIELSMEANLLPYWEDV